MPKQLDIIDLVEILFFDTHPKYEEIRARLEHLTQDAAELVAEQHHLEIGTAVWEGKDFAGCCCPVSPIDPDQPLPVSFALAGADEGGDWGNIEEGPPYAPIRDQWFKERETKRC